MDILGMQAYQSIDKAVVFDQLMRQSGSKDAEFGQMLLEIREGKLTDEIFEILSSRYIRNLNADELKLFASIQTTFLFSERLDCDTYNNFRVHHMGAQVVAIYPQDSKPCPIDITNRDVLNLCVGCPVILNFNLAPQVQRPKGKIRFISRVLKIFLFKVGLFNSAMGFVTQIVEPRKEDKGFHQIVFVRFKSYCGVRFQFRDDIPVLRRTTQETCPLSGKVWKRRHFPLSLGFSITIHRAMGMTLPRICIGVPPPEQTRTMFSSLAPSILYVAMSRVRSLEHLSFRFPLQRRFIVNPRGQHYIEWTTEMERLRQLEAAMDQDQPEDAE
jgi:hypothetical protein